MTPNMCIDSFTLKLESSDPILSPSIIRYGAPVLQPI